MLEHNENEILEFIKEMKTVGVHTLMEFKSDDSDTNLWQCEECQWSSNLVEFEFEAAYQHSIFMLSAKGVFKKIDYTYFAHEAESNKFSRVRFAPPKCEGVISPYELWAMENDVHPCIFAEARNKYFNEGAQWALRQIPTLEEIAECFYEGEQGLRGGLRGGKFEDLDEFNKEVYRELSMKVVEKIEDRIIASMLDEEETKY